MASEANPAQPNTPQIIITLTDSGIAVTSNVNKGTAILMLVDTFFAIYQQKQEASPIIPANVLPFGPR